MFNMLEVETPDGCFVDRITDENITILKNLLFFLKHQQRIMLYIASLGNKIKTNFNYIVP